jgi:hypothetical protein
MVEYFNKPWMDNINPELLYRYWLTKKDSRHLRLQSFGLNLTHHKTPHGVLTIITPPGLPNHVPPKGR